MIPSNDENLMLKQCPFCAEKIHTLAKKCRYCGEIVDPTLRMVSDMQQSVKVTVIPSSGITVNPESTATTHNIATNTNLPKQRIAYILLGLFLGGFGIHNFYAGYSNKAIAQLLISLLIGWLIIPYIAVVIWSLIEICTVDKDAKGVLFC